MKSHPELEAALRWAETGEAHPGPCLNYENQDPEDYSEWDSCYLHLEASSKHRAALADEIRRVLEPEPRPTSRRRFWLKEPSDATRRFSLVLSNHLAEWAYWKIPFFRDAVHAWSSRPAGFNPTTDERRLAAIELQLYRGQPFITADNARFLLKKIRENSSPYR